MTKFIQAQNLSLAWLAGLEHLLTCGGKDTNVIVEIGKAGEEDEHIRQLLDEFLVERSAYCAGRLPQLAVRFAGKEATAKALGTGIGEVDWNEIEVLVDHAGCPFVSLYGYALIRAGQRGLSTWAISLSHSPHLAIAFVIASCTNICSP